MPLKKKRCTGLEFTLYIKKKLYICNTADVFEYFKSNHERAPKKNYLNDD